MTVYHFKNATGKNRFSSFDITEDDEEPDPLHTRFGGSRPEPPRPDGRKRFCPYCGTEAAADFSFCQSCGRKLP